jgi:hypothetical protein
MILSKEHKKILLALHLGHCLTATIAKERIGRRIGYTRITTFSWLVTPKEMKKSPNYDLLVQLRKNGLTAYDDREKVRHVTLTFKSKKWISENE